MVNTLVQDDVQYIEAYLFDKDPLTLSNVPHTMSNVSSINFYMSDYQDVTAVRTTCAVITSTLGLVRTGMFTVPVAGEYKAEFEVFESNQKLTWRGLYYKIEPDIGD